VTGQIKPVSLWVLLKRGSTMKAEATMLGSPAAVGVSEGGNGGAVPFGAPQLKIPPVPLRLTAAGGVDGQLLAAPVPELAQSYVDPEVNRIRPLMASQELGPAETLTDKKRARMPAAASPGPSWPSPRIQPLCVPVVNLVEALTHIALPPSFVGA